MVKMRIKMVKMRIEMMNMWIEMVKMWIKMVNMWIEMVKMRMLRMIYPECDGQVENVDKGSALRHANE